MAGQASSERADRSGIDPAFQAVWARQHNPHKARETLSAAIYNNFPRLYRDGVVVSVPEMLDIGLYLRASVEPDGRWYCVIETREPRRVMVESVDDSGPVQRMRVVLAPEPVWEVARHELDELVEALDSVSGPPPPRGRKPGQPPAQGEMCKAALNILKDNALRPPRGHGRVTALARQILPGHPGYELDTVADYIRAVVREWEDQNPSK